MNIDSPKIVTPLVKTNDRKTTPPVIINQKTMAVFKKK